jgi:hypothetical protein
MKIKCQECKKSDKVVKAYYLIGKKKDYYLECERCYCVVKRISTFSLY